LVKHLTVDKWNKLEMIKDVVTVNASNPIIKIEPYHKSFIIHWLIGNKCNYSCSYCPDMWHSYNSRLKPLGELQAAWLRILEVNKSKHKKYELGFLGGENTLNKDFLPFIAWLYNEHHDIIANIGFTTNGTASVKYYTEIMKYCDWITFSTHSEFINEEKFFTKIIKINKLSKSLKCNIKVNIMDEPWHRERIKEYKEFLDKLNIDNYIHPIHDFKEGKTPLPAKTKNINFYDSKFTQR
jgi:pyruvate-formate lyase-activating enzyme